MLRLEEAIVSLEQRTSSLPSLEEFVCILHKCRKERSLTLALRVHAYMRKNELDIHIVLGNYLLVMLVEAGSMYHAQQVFDRLGHVDECAWNYLISGYVKHQEPRHALVLYGKLQEDSSAQCNAHTYVALLKACTELKDLENGIQIHADIARKGFLEVDLFIGSALIDTYAKCGRITSAQEVFDHLPTQNVVSWTSLMVGYAEHGHSEEALCLYERMQCEGIVPSAITFICILKVCGFLCTTSMGQQVHSNLVELGLEGDIAVGNTLVLMYAKCSSLLAAQSVFDKLSARDAALWNTLLAGYAEDGHGEKAFQLFEQMQHESISSDTFTFVCILKACSKCGALREGQQVHCQITRKGLERDVFVGSTLVDMYAKHGALAESHCVFDHLPVQGLVSWNSLLAGYAGNRCFEEALYLYEKMQDVGVPADDITFVCVLEVCGHIGAIDMTYKLHTEITRKGQEVGPHIFNALADAYAKCGLIEEAQNVINTSTNQTIVSCKTLVSGYTEQDQNVETLVNVQLPQCGVTLLCSLKACASKKDFDEGLKIHGEIVKMGLSASDGFVGSALINMYGKCGLVAEAQAVFDRLATKDAVSWTALVGIYAAQGACDKVLDCLHQMQLDGISPVAATFVCMLKSCICEEILGQIHMDIVERGLDRDLVVGSTLVDIYAKSGLLVESHAVFDKLSSPDIVTYTALIAGYVEHGCGEEAVCCFKQMQHEGVFQSAFTYACVLKACMMTTSTQMGEELHDEVVRKGFEEDPFVGSSLINLYSKLGFLVEAQGLFDKLPNRSVVSFNALLAGYTLHEHGEKALRLLDQMRHEGICPDLLTFICSPKVCGALRAVEKGHHVHAEITMKGLMERDLFLGSSLVSMYSKCGCLVDAHGVFDKLPVRDVVTWMALIEGYAEHGSDLDAFDCYEQMQSEGVTPVAVTFVNMLRYCCSTQDIDKARELHVDIAKKGFDKDHSVGKMLVVAYAKCVQLDDANQVFERLDGQEDFTWTILEKGSKEAIDCCDQMYSQFMSKSI